MHTQCVVKKKNDSLWYASDSITHNRSKYSSSSVLFSRFCDSLVYDIQHKMEFNFNIKLCNKFIAIICICKNGTQADVKIEMNFPASQVNKPCISWLEPNYQFCQEFIYTPTDNLSQIRHLLLKIL